MPKHSFHLWDEYTDPTPEEQAIINAAYEIRKRKIFEWTKDKIREIQAQAENNLKVAQSNRKGSIVWYGDREEAERMVRDALPTNDKND